MSHKTRTVLSCVGLALSAAGSICIALANGACNSPIPSGRLNVNACTGAACDPATPPPPAPKP